MPIDESILQALETTSIERLESCETQREQLGRPTPQELYWGGYADAILQLQGKLTRSNLDWLSDGIARMFTKQEVQKRITESILSCDACSLCKGRTQAVPGTGPLWTPLAVIGEAPGAEEDVTGIPFCGKSGQLLFSSDGLIPSVLGYQREHILIRNVCCCRPPGNANPDTEQILSCASYLRSSLLNVYPKVILSVGVTPTSWFYGEQIAIGDVRGKVFYWEGIPVVPTYHPAYLLRNSNATHIVQDDLKVLGDILRG